MAKSLIVRPFFATVAILVCVLGTGTARAAESPWSTFADPVFMRLPSSELPNQLAQVITSDNSGFIWVGTQAGLARFDGYHYRIYLPDAADKRALPDGFVNAILSDGDGGLWIGCNSGGLVHYDPATDDFQSWPRDSTGRTGPRSATIYAIARDANDRLLIGGDHGLDQFDVRTNAFRSIKLDAHEPSPAVYTVLADRQTGGRVWVGTENGLFVRSASSSKLKQFALDSGAGRIRSLYQDAMGRLWAGGDGVLYVIDRTMHVVDAFASSQTESASLEPGAVLAMNEIRPGVIWAGGFGGLSIVDVRTHRVHRVAEDLQFAGGFVGGRVFSLYRDRAGLIWLGGDGGVIVHNATTTGLSLLSSTRLGIGPSGVAGAKALTLSGSDLWIGSYLGKVVALNPDDGSVTSIVMPNGLFVRKLSPASGSNVWLGAGDQFLCLVQTASIQIACPANPQGLPAVRSRFAVETHDDVWVATYDGAYAINKITRRVSHYAAGDAPGTLSNGTVAALMADREGNMWVGTYRGLNEIHVKTKRVERFLRGELIGSLYEDRRGRIWAGANGGPLNVLERNGDAMQIAQLRRADGMPNDTVSAIAEDPSGRIWASTDRGIALIDPVSLHARGLGLIDGVTGNGHWNGAVAQSKDGTIFLGGSDGVTVIAPGAASPWNYTPPLVVTSITAGGHRIPEWNTNRTLALQLPANARNFSVEFAALDYSGPRSIQYAYKLDGLDRDWINADTEHRIATYTNLAAGSYTLIVRATNRLGKWSTHDLALSIRVVPAWYETWWFRALIGLLLLVAAIAVYGMGKAVSKKRQLELEELVDARTRELHDVNQNLYVANENLSAANAKLEESSVTDPLTGLRNRRFLIQHLDVDVAAALRRYHDWRVAPTSSFPPQADLLFFMVDIDFFKSVNDEHGHHAGDLILRQMRDRLEQVFRTTDYVVRWGGEEFLAVARMSNRSEARDIAERLRNAVASEPFTIGNGMLDKTISIGFAAFPFIPQAPTALTWSQVVDLADRALYMAKNGGRNTWVGLVATERTEPDTLEDADLEIVRPQAAGGVEVLGESITS